MSAPKSYRGKLQRQRLMRYPLVGVTAAISIPTVAYARLRGKITAHVLSFLRSFLADESLKDGKSPNSTSSLQHPSAEPSTPQSPRTIISKDNVPRQTMQRPSGLSMPAQSTGESSVSGFDKKTAQVNEAGTDNLRGKGLWSTLRSRYRKDSGEPYLV